MQEKIIRELEESYEESRREKGAPHLFSNHENES
jgi:hypothetical protein